MSEIKKFLKLSKSVGEDFNLIQGPGEILAIRIEI